MDMFFCALSYAEVAFTTYCCALLSSVSIFHYNKNSTVNVIDVAKILRHLTTRIVNLLCHIHCVPKKYYTKLMAISR